MYSFLMAENRTDFPAVTICGADGIIFSDIPKGETSGLRLVEPGSLRLEIFDNYMRAVTVLWLPIRPHSRVKLIIYPDLAQFILLS